MNASRQTGLALLVYHVSLLSWGFVPGWQF